MQKGVVWLAGTRWKPGGEALYRKIRIKELKEGDRK
jgi:hypothetical protein